MAVLGMLVRTGLRARWRSWCLLAVLVALVGGLALAAGAAARRTESAFPRYAATHGFSTLLYSINPLPGLDHLADVTSVVPVALPSAGALTCACTRPVNENEFGIFQLSRTELPRLAQLESGRLPNQNDATEVLASYTMARDYGLHIGSVLRLSLFTPAQKNAVEANQALSPAGPSVALHIVGFSAAEFEFPSSEAPSYDIYTTHAFARTFGRDTFDFHAYFVRLRHGSADLPRFQAETRKSGGLGGTDLGSVATAIESSIHPQVVGWWLLAALAALVGLIVLAQAIARQATVEAETYPALRAVGASGRQLRTFALVRTLLIGLSGALGAVLLAFVLSPLTPVGEAKLAQPDDGFGFDATFLLLGAIALLGVVVLISLWPALRTARVRVRRDAPLVTHPSRITGLLAAAGAPPSMLVGVRHAIERGRGRSAIPVGSALLGAILAVGTLSATVVFSASLTHLTRTPSLYGQPFQAWFQVNAFGPKAQNTQMLARLEHDAALTAITAGVSGTVIINGHSITALAGQSLRGQVLITTVAGHLPDGPRQIVLGRTTLRQVGAALGSTVRVKRGTSHGTTTASYRVVGTAVFPPDFVGTGLGNGALFSLQGLTGSLCRGPTAPRDACAARILIAHEGAVLVRASPTLRGQAELTRLSRVYSSVVQLPNPPTTLVNFGEAVNFPLLFGVILVIFGTATLLHLLVVSVVRRRREVGLLKTLGFVRRQVALAVTWQTTTVALVGVVVGIPVGIAVGRAVWQLFANSQGTAAVPVVVAWTMALVAAAAVVIANVLAIGPALVAARSRPAGLLKAE